MKLYLAHPIVLRHEIRKIELEIEANTGIELINPFYDTERKDIEALDRGEKTIIEYGDALNPDTIVQGDLYLINSSAGTVAYLDRTVPMIGVVCEIWHTFAVCRKPVFIVSPNCLFHPWVKYIAKHSNGTCSTDWLAFEAWVGNK